jgi:hypothetical protein
MPERKKQHYVPKVYLKNFAVKNKTKYCLYCLDKKDSREFKTSLNSIGAENYFYSNDVDISEAFEKYLSQIEGDYKTVYNKIVNNMNLDSINEKDKKIISLFVAM